MERGLGMFAAEVGFNPRQDNRKIKGLCCIIVGSQTERFDNVSVSMIRADHDDWNLRGCPGLSESFQDLKTTHPWHLDIQENQIEVPFGDQFQCLLTIFSGGSGVAVFFEPARQ